MSSEEAADAAAAGEAALASQRALGQVPPFLGVGVNSEGLRGPGMTLSDLPVLRLRWQYVYENMRCRE